MSHINDLTIPVLTIPVLSITSEPSPEQILERIKDIPLYGRGEAYRGYPNDVNIENLVSYTNKEGKFIWAGPGGLESVPDYMDELVKDHGVLCRETVGKIYWLSTTEPNPSMTDGVTGNSTGFQYRVYNDGREDLYFDAVPSGRTHLFWEKPELKKTSNPSLRKVIEVMNPNSKLL